MITLKVDCDSNQNGWNHPCTTVNLIGNVKTVSTVCGGIFDYLSGILVSHELPILKHIHVSNGFNLKLKFETESEISNVHLVRRELG